MGEPKLVAELVPSSTWGWNLRSVLTEKGWGVVRQKVYEKAGSLCQICGGKGSKHPVECHERWVYDDRKHVQKLVGLEALCPSCHEVRHIGRAFQVGRGPKAMRHMMKVNSWTLEQVEAHIEEAMKIWKGRSSFVWKLDLTWLGGVPTEFLKASKG